MGPGPAERGVGHGLKPGHHPLDVGRCAGQHDAGDLLDHGIVGGAQTGGGLFRPGAQARIRDVNAGLDCQDPPPTIGSQDGGGDCGKTDEA